MLVKLFWTDRWNNGDLYPEALHTTKKTKKSIKAKA